MEAYLIAISIGILIYMLMAAVLVFRPEGLFPASSR